MGRNAPLGYSSEGNQMIIFDYQPAIGGRNTGVGIYTAEIYSALKTLLGEELQAIRRKTNHPIRTVAERVYWEQVQVPLLLTSRKAHIFHSPGFALPLFSSVPCIVTVHDVAYFQFPRMLPGYASRFYWLSLAPASWRKAAQILTVSQTTKQALMETLHFPEEKLTAILSGTPTDIHFLPQEEHRFPLLKNLCDYLLFVGTLEVRKNLHTLLDAYGLLLSRKIFVPLVIVGEFRNDYGRKMQRYVAETLSTAPIHFLGFVPRNFMSEVYSRAILYVSPSLAEGFGFCPLEAMSCDVPCVASRIPAHQEVLGDSAWLVSLNNPEELAYACEKLLTDSDLRRAFCQKGREKVAELTWQKTAEKTAELYRSLFQ